MESRRLRGLLRGCLFTALLTASGTSDWVAACAAGDQLAVGPVHSLLDQALDASGVAQGAARDYWVERFGETVAPLVEKAAQSRTDYRKAKRLHRLLHSHLFTKYRSDANSLREVLTGGEFNCVSAALTEGIAARLLGIEVQAVEAPRHVFLRMRIGGRRIDVEPGVANGFNQRWDTPHARRFLLAYKLATPEELGTDPAQVMDAYRELRAPVDLEQATAYLRINRALDAVDRGEAEEAARQLAAAMTELPSFVQRADDIGVAFARAFRIAYDAGQFDQAFDIAALDLKAIPGRVSAQDRLVAAAAKRVESFSASGSLEEAESVINFIRSDYPDLSARLDLAVCPTAALAAVRAGDFDRAERFAMRFEAAGAGNVGGESLESWVRAHKAAFLRSASKSPLK